MMLNLDRALNRRIRMCLPLVLVLSFVLLAWIPLAAGDAEHRVNASMYVSRTEASPGDNVTFWIWVDPLKENARKLVVTESTLDGFIVVSSVAPDSCLEKTGTWVCVQDDLRPFTIEVHVVVDIGTAGRDLINEARIEVWNSHGDNEGGEHGSSSPISVSAGVHIVPASVVEEPEIEVQLSAPESAIVPGNPVTYRVNVTNRGTAVAHNVLVVVSMPETMVFVSSSLQPVWQDGRLSWTLESLPVGSMVLLFNATLPPSNGVDQVDVGLAATYGDGEGGKIRVETSPSSLLVLPVPSSPLFSPLPLGIIVAVFAFVARSLFVPEGPIALPFWKGTGADEIFLLHRSGVLLRHASPIPTRDTDSDIVGGMLAAVRMFVEDSMHPSAGPLQEIRFRGGSIIFVNGVSATLAAVNVRGSRVRFAHRAIGFLREFESLNGSALTKFDGEAGTLNGVDALLSRVAA